MNLRRLFRRRRSDAELQEEIEAYLEEETADNVARGISPIEARRQARIMLGNPQRVREELWQQNTLTIIDNLWRDLKYATRTSEADTRICHDCDSCDGAGHRRECRAFHGCTQRPAQPFAFLGSKSTHRFVWKGRHWQGRYCCGG